MTTEQTLEAPPTTDSTQNLSFQTSRPLHNSEVQSEEVEQHPENKQEENDDALSPSSLRRSSRVSALIAQKKIKSTEMVDSQIETGDGVDGQLVNLDCPQSAITYLATDDPLAKKKKKQLNEVDLDQYDCKFGIRVDSDGKVVLMTDESEISSLNDEQVMDLRKKYNLSKSHILPEEVKIHREEQIKELEAELRLEEAKLSMLKKIRQNQQQAQLRNHQENTKKLPPSLNQNSVNNAYAYKPKVADVASQNNASKVNGTSKTSRSASKTAVSNSTNSNVAATLASLANSLNPQHQQIFQTLLAKLGNNPAQLQQLLQTLQNPANNISALVQQNSARQQQQNAGSTNNAQTNTPSGPSAAELANKAKEIAYNNQQRIAAARLAMRRALEQQILQLTTPKAPVQDLNFIPNGNQPDFCSLLGLDLTVQRVLKDKGVFKKVDFSPYICEECGSDYTPSWKAICGEKGDYHLYCEHCVRQAQKRKVRQDQTALLKRAFQKVQEQEKEFEKQVAAGKFSDPIPSVPSATTTNSNNSLVAASANAMNLSITPSKQQQSNSSNSHHSAHQHTSLASAGQHQQTSSSNRAGNATASNHSTPRSQTTSSSRPAKRPANTNSSSTTSNSSSNAATLAALSNNPMLQQQLAAMRAISQLSSQMNMSNVNQQMLAAAMMSQNSNPMLMQQIWQQMNQAMQSQRAAPQAQTTQANYTSANNINNNTNTNNNAGMAALLQAVQQSSQSNSQQNNSSSSSASTAVNNSSSSNSSNPAVNGLNPLLAASLNAQLSQMGAGNFMNNPQLMRQFQQAHLAQQMRDMAKSNKK